MKQTAIVVIAYNREKSLKRLLQSLEKASYQQSGENGLLIGSGIPLIISIDHSENNLVRIVADDFKWTHGEKRVIVHPENMGLKKHVLSCGDLVDQYDSIVMLEDDLYVSASFYGFAQKALESVWEEDRIAGVSLYTHLLNVHTREPFLALEDGYDNWFFQFASSWGQAFTKNQWNGFREWMKRNDGKELASKNMPVNVSEWSQKSWLKYFIAYMIETDRYFLYPRISQTTNFSEEGTHAKETVMDLQVPLYNRQKRPYCFSKLSHSEAVYDAFFENVCLKKLIANQTGAKPGEIMIDLYGSRPFAGEQRILLSSIPMPCKIIRKYGCALRPIEANVIENIEGNDFFLYDTSQKGKEPKVSPVRKYLYHYRAFKTKYGLEILVYRIKQRFFER